jgi:prepilin peptidase CpaA
MEYLVYGSVFGGALTLALLQFRAFPLPALLVGQTWAERLHEKKGGVPYGIALAAAALVIYPTTPWMQSITG